MGKGSFFSLFFLFSVYLQFSTPLCANNSTFFSWAKNAQEKGMERCSGQLELRIVFSCFCGLCNFKDSIFFKDFFSERRWCHFSLMLSNLKKDFSDHEDVSRSLWSVQFSRPFFLTTPFLAISAQLASTKNQVLSQPQSWANGRTVNVKEETKQLFKTEKTF